MTFTLIFLHISRSVTSFSYQLTGDGPGRWFDCGLAFLAEGIRSSMKRSLQRSTALRLKKCDIWPSDIQKISCVVVELRILASRYVFKMIRYLDFSEFREKK